MMPGVRQTGFLGTFCYVTNKTPTPQVGLYTHMQYTENMNANDFYNRDDSEYSSLPGFRDVSDDLHVCASDVIDGYVIAVEAGTASTDSELLRCFSKFWIEGRYYEVPVSMQNAVRRIVDANPLRNKYVLFGDCIMRIGHTDFCRMRDAGFLACERNHRHYEFVGATIEQEFSNAVDSAGHQGEDRLLDVLSTTEALRPLAKSVAYGLGVVCSHARADDDWEKTLDGMEDHHVLASERVRPLDPLELVVPRAGEDFFARAKVWAAIAGPRVVARRRHVGAVVRTITAALASVRLQPGRHALFEQGYTAEAIEAYEDSLRARRTEYEDELVMLDAVMTDMFVKQTSVRPEGFDINSLVKTIGDGLKKPFAMIWKLVDDLWIDHPTETWLILSLVGCFMLGMLLRRLPPCRTSTVVTAISCIMMYLYVGHTARGALNQQAFIDHMMMRRQAGCTANAVQRTDKDAAFRKRHKLSEELWNFFEDLKDDLAEEETEEDGNAVQAQGLGTGVLAAVVMGTFFKKIPTFVKIVNARKFEDGISSMLTGSLGAFEAMLNLVLRSMGRKEVALLKSQNAMVDCWRDSAVAFSHRIATGALDPSTPQAAGVYEQLRDQGITYQATHKVGEAQRVVKVGMDALIRISAHFPNTGACRGRMEPIAMCLTGTAGCGKSDLARLLSVDFVHGCCSAEEKEAMRGPDGLTDYNRLVFQKGASEYWEGYCGQPVCVMDDFLQALPVPGPDTEVASFIRAVNQWPYPLNMATLELKGKFFFKSKFVLITTNVKNLTDTKKVIACTEAVARRFTHSYTVRPTPEYTLPGGWLDPTYKSRIDTSGPGGGLDEVWDFYEYSLLTEVESSIPLKYSQVQERMRADYVRRVSIEQQNVEFLNNRVNAQGLLNVAAVGVVAVGAAQLAVHTARRVGAAVVRGAKREAFDALGSPLFKGLTAVALIASVVAAMKLVKFTVKTLLQSLGLWRKDSVSAQGAAMSSPDEVVARARANGVHVYASGRRLGHGVMVASRLLMIPKHYMLQANTTTFEVCNRLGKRLALTVGDQLANMEGSKDCVCFATDRQVDGMADIRTHFWDPGCQYSTDRAYMVNNETCVNTRIAGWPQVRNYEKMDLRSKLTHHTARTRVGDCGSLIINADPKARKRIMGMHAAGDWSGGFYVPISCQELSSVSAQAHLGFEEVAKVGALYNSGDTSFVRTPYAGYFAPVVGAPSALRPREVDGVRVDPMLKAVAATNRDFGICELPDDLPDIADHLVGEIFSFFEDDPLEQLSYEQAVAGVPGEPYIKGIARGKSMGYPGCTKYHNKRPAFGAEGDYTFDGEAAEYVRRLHDELLEDYRNNKKSAIFRDVLKDEIRPFAKVDAADTRLISASPVQYTILCRRVFARYTAAFMRTRLQHGGLVGINPFGREWTHIHDALKNKNTQGLAASGDYKQFDKSQHQQVLRQLLKAIARRLPGGEIEDKVVNMIIEDTVRSIHLGGDSYRSDVVYQTEGSLPSGHPMTSVLNSMYNMLVFRLVWRDSAPHRDHWNFRKHVQLYVFGDDNLFAPDDANISFGLDTMAEGVGKYGLVYTSEEKDGPLYHLKPLGRCSFLKRGFGQEPDYVFAPLEEASICDMFNWQRKKTPEEVHLRQVADAALMEYSAHEFCKFEQFLCKLRPLLKAHGVCDPTFGVEASAAYRRQRSIYKLNVPEWSVE